MYTQDHLRFLAEKYINNTEYDFDTIKKINISREFYDQYGKYFKKGTMVKINANGHTTDGKSTVMAKLVKIANEKHLNRKMSEKYILGNQQEYAYWVQRNPKEKHLMLQIDEWSKLAETGANATIERAYLEELSNIHAQMYIHVGYCSPHLLPDENIIIHLEVASRDDVNMKTICYIYYYLSRMGQHVPQIIGHIEVDVKDVIQSNWYKRYRENKHKKINLLREHNIDHERELYYAKPIKDIIKSFMGLTQMGKNITERAIVSKAKVYCAKNGIRMTMLGIDYVIVNDVKPILDTYVQSVKMSDEIIQLKKKKRNMGHYNEVDEVNFKIKKLQEQLKINDSDIDFYMNELNRKEKLFEQYKNIV